MYLKNNKAPKGTESLKGHASWERVVVDNFGPLDPNQHVGTIHHVATVQFGNSDVNSFAIACMGARASDSSQLP